MKSLRRLLLVGALCAGSASIALADVPAVSFEYTSSSRVEGQKQPLSQVKSYVSVQPGRVRKLIKYAVDMPTPPGSAGCGCGPSSPFDSFFARLGGYHTGGIGFVVDRNNDKFIAYSSELNGYIEQPRLEFLKQLRFDPFSKIDPELSKTIPPQLSPQQRERLGREIGSAARAFLKDNMRIYFRPLQGSRNFKSLDGVATHGYRMTMLFNMSPPGLPPAWSRTSSEWWIADPLPGDNLVRQLTAERFSDLQRIGGFSTSMWINESLPILWEALPQELRDAVQTYMPLPPSSHAWYSGTLVYLAVTSDTGNIGLSNGITRTEMKLTHRSTAAVRDSLFLAPGTYEKQDLAPALEMYKKMSASLLDSDGPFFNFMAMGQLPLQQTLPLASPMLPAMNSPFMTNFRKAVFPAL